MSNNKVVMRDHKTIKKWSYQRGHMDLKFEINIDIKSDVMDFKELLAEAVNDLDEQLKNYDN